MTEPRLSRRTLLGGVAATAVLGARLPQAMADGGGAARLRRQPAAFVGHGSPMLAVDATKGAEFARWAAAMPRPTAVLVVSAHFERSPVTVGATTTLPLIYDFGGFPRALYEIRYPAPGAPDLAQRVAGRLAPLGDVRSDPRRGLDHGAWVPLKWMYPGADVPVLPVSLPTHDPRHLWRLGRALRPLRDEGVLILASGSATHNLRRLGPEGSPVPAWAGEFDQWLAETVSAGDDGALLDWERRAPAARTNHPTVEHFVPLLLAAAARHDDEGPAFPITGFEGASISRRSVQWG
jgi:4,5-DOPA dioxygenase extradiol